MSRCRVGTATIYQVHPWCRWLHLCGAACLLGICWGVVPNVLGSNEGDTEVGGLLLAACGRFHDGHWGVRSKEGCGGITCGATTAGTGVGVGTAQLAEDSCLLRVLRV